MNEPKWKINVNANWSSPEKVPRQLNLQLDEAMPEETVEDFLDGLNAFIKRFKEKHRAMGSNNE